MYQALNLSAGVAVEFYEVADFFRILAAPAVDITVIFYRNGAEEGRAENVGAGYAENFSEAIDKVRIQSTGGGAVAFVSRIGGSVRYDTPPNGAVTVTNVNGAFSNTEKTVTNASAQLSADNAARRYLLIQNKDTAGAIYINFGALAATLANGVKVPAGGSYELQGYCSMDAIQAIGDIGSNANILIVEG
jgi:hypothetical protein